MVGLWLPERMSVVLALTVVKPACVLPLEKFTVALPLPVEFTRLTPAVVSEPLAWILPETASVPPAGTASVRDLPVLAVAPRVMLPAKVAVPVVLPNEIFAELAPRRSETTTGLAT